MVCIDYKDAAYLEEECREGAELGFSGKQAIHPAQLETVNREYAPSPEGMLCTRSLLTRDISRAEAILHAYEASLREKHAGAVGLRHAGRDLMIDACVNCGAAADGSPMLLQARRMLARR